MHSNPRIPDFTIVGHHSCIFLLPCKRSVVGEASGPIRQWQVVHAVCQLPTLLGLWITFFWVPHTQFGSRKTNCIVEWFVIKNWLYWFWFFACLLFFNIFSLCQQLSTASVWMKDLWLGIHVSFHFCFWVFFSFLPHYSENPALLLYRCYLICVLQGLDQFGDLRSSWPRHSALLPN